MRRPTPFGKYYLLDRVNVGGMAEVFRAKATGVEGFEKLVAIKRILPNIAEDDEFITMFIDEAKIAVQLTHANIAQIYDLGKIQESYFIALEFVPGKDLRTIFERCRKRGEILPIPMSCYVVSRVCEGLDYAHRKKDPQGRDLNIVHRDISPQNILVAYEGEVKIIDFGIAKAANKASKTQAGILKGKFGYMSPEQVRGLPIDRRSDVFSVGIVLYELLTGERLFVGESDFSTLEKVRNVEIMPPTTYNRRIPEDLEAIVLKALSREPEERFQHAIELQEELNRFLILSGNMFSRKDLAIYMKNGFSDDIDREQTALDQFREGPPTPSPVQIAAQTARPPPPPPPPPQRGNGPLHHVDFGESEDLATRVVDPRESHPDLLAESADAGRVAVPLPPGGTDAEAPALALQTNAGAPVYRMPLQPPSKRRRNVLIFVTIAALASAAVVLFLYLRSLKTQRTAPLEIATAAGASVKICSGGECSSLGLVPASGTLKAHHQSGRYRIEAHKPGCGRREVEASLVARKANRITIALQCSATPRKTATGVLRLETDPPGAKVRFVAKEHSAWSGTAPILRRAVPTGEYQAEISKKGFFPRRVLLTVRGDGTHPAKVSLPARIVYLEVVTDPAKVKVVVRNAENNRVVAKPRRLTPLKLRLRRPSLTAAFHVELSKKGYESWEGPVVFNGMPSQKLSNGPIELKRKSQSRRRTPPRVAKKPPTPVVVKPPPPQPEKIEFGTLNVNLKGAWAYVKINDRDIGQTTPLLGWKLKTGRHKVTLFRKELGFKDEFFVKIAANQPKRVLRKFRTP